MTNCSVDEHKQGNHGFTQQPSFSIGFFLATPPSSTISMNTPQIQKRHDFYFSYTTLEDCFSNHKFIVTIESCLFKGMSWSTFSYSRFHRTYRISKNHSLYSQKNAGKENIEHHRVRLYPMGQVCCVEAIQNRAGNKLLSNPILALFFSGNTSI